MPGKVVTESTGSSVIGYFGKVPTRGDFVQSQLPRAFLDPWDDWLQRAIAASKSELGDGWLDKYLTSPIWRFALCSGICGEPAVAGVVMPSVDSVGRYYPMTLANLRAAREHPFSLAKTGPSWFKEAEDIALTCLDDGFQLETLEERLTSSMSLADEEGDETLPFAQSFTISGNGLNCLLSDEAVDQLCPGVFADLLDQLARDKFDRYSLWWTSGSNLVPPSLRICDGLPSVDEYAAFLCNTAS